MKRIGDLPPDEIRAIVNESKLTCHSIVASAHGTTIGTVKKLVKMERWSEQI